MRAETGRWAGPRRSLWQPPRPHGEAPRERVVGPLELFYDLAVVVLVAQAAHHLAGHLTWPGLGEFAAIFTLVWIAWANGSLHHELHGHDDARARSTFLLQIVVLAAMGASSRRRTERAERVRRRRGGGALRSRSAGELDRARRELMLSRLVPGRGSAAVALSARSGASQPRRLVMRSGDG